MRVKLAIPEPEDRWNYERHEVYYGEKNRKHSLKWGCIIYLPHILHNTNYTTSIHRDIDFDNGVKAEYQQALEASGWTRGEFIQTFGRNYL